MIGHGESRRRKQRASCGRICISTGGIALRVQIISGSPLCGVSESVVHHVLNLMRKKMLAAVKFEPRFSDICGAHAPGRSSAASRARHRAPPSTKEAEVGAMTSVVTSGFFSVGHHHAYSKRTAMTVSLRRAAATRLVEGDRGETPDRQYQRVAAS
ncbi:hypothetical protein P5V15_010923 [Pogonomyrmex californicus]